jgi:hypothetical protein
MKNWTTAEIMTLRAPRRPLRVAMHLLALAGFVACAAGLLWLAYSLGRDDGATALLIAFEQVGCVGLPR